MHVLEPEDQNRTDFLGGVGVDEITLSWILKIAISVVQLQPSVCLLRVLPNVWNIYPCGVYPVALLTYTIQTYNIKYIYIYMVRNRN
jgi:hypothetical protein